MAASPLFSEGARYERAAIRKYLRRMLRNHSDNPALLAVLGWLITRSKRYDKVPGGLGKK